MEAFNPTPPKINALVHRGLIALTGKADATAAWRSLVTTNDVVGIKVYAAPGANSGTRPAVAEAVVKGLLAAGLQPHNIVIWDKHLESLQRAGFEAVAQRHDIRLAGAANAGYDEKVFYSSPIIGQLVWGDVEFGRKGEDIGKKSFVSKLVTQDLTKIINLTPLLNHNQAGVSGNLVGLALGSVDNSIRFESEAERLAVAIPEIYALQAVGDRVVLNIVDGLICQYHGEQRGLLHYSAVLGELRFSKDPLALDVLSLAELERQREIAKAPAVKKDYSPLYKNAALVEIGVQDRRRINVENH
jgi:uncharacterized protein (DUF362 family)